MAEILDSLFTVINTDSNPKEIILILHIAQLVLILDLIPLKTSLKNLQNPTSIPKKRTQNQSLPIGKPLRIVLLPTSSLMLDHMADHHFPKLLNC